MLGKSWLIAEERLVYWNIIAMQIFEGVILNLFSVLYSSKVYRKFEIQLFLTLAFLKII